MTEHESVMYKIMGSISNSSVPLIFKGGLIVKLLFMENDFSEVERATKDIDASWVENVPSMDELVSIINSCIKSVNIHYNAVAVRNYGERRSAGISIIDSSTGDEVVSMDIDIKPALGVKEYSIGELRIRGVLSDEILMDKINVLSREIIFRRIKDMVDIYALSHCIEVTTGKIFTAFQDACKECGDFQAFNTRKDELRHAYDKLIIVKGKPEFENVYSYLQQFIKPFQREDTGINLVWNSSTREWYAEG